MASLPMLRIDLVHAGSLAIWVSTPPARSLGTPKPSEAPPDSCRNPATSGQAAPLKHDTSKHSGNTTASCQSRPRACELSFVASPLLVTAPRVILPDLLRRGFRPPPASDPHHQRHMNPHSLPSLAAGKRVSCCHGTLGDTPAALSGDRRQYSGIAALATLAHPAAIRFDLETMSFIASCSFHNALLAPSQITSYDASIMSCLAWLPSAGT